MVEVVVMPQLVGAACVLCQKKVGSVLEGRFCDGCRHAVHDKCIKPEEERTGEGHCPACGAENKLAAAVAHAEESRRQAVLRGPEAYPVSKLCPQCGGTDYKQRRPKKWIAFIQDRECTKCQTRYTPPTPVWAGVVFIMTGVGLLGWIGLGLFLSWAAGRPAVGGVLDWFLIVMGVLALIHGIRSLSNPGGV